MKSYCAACMFAVMYVYSKLFDLKMVVSADVGSFSTFCLISLCMCYVALVVCGHIYRSPLSNLLKDFFSLALCLFCAFYCLLPLSSILHSPDRISFDYGNVKSKMIFISALPWSVKRSAQFIQNAKKNKTNEKSYYIVIGLNTTRTKSKTDHMNHHKPSS